MPHYVQSTHSIVPTDEVQTIVKILSTIQHMIESVAHIFTARRNLHITGTDWKQPFKLQII